MLNRIFRVSLALGLCTLGLLATSPARAEVPSTMTHQGRLLEEGDTPVQGEVQMTFTIYDAETGGSILWETSQTVETDTSGFYSTTLGSDDNPLTPGVFEGGSAWLAVSIEGGEEMEPRMQLNTTPYAKRAELAENVDDGSVESSDLADDFEVESDQVGGVNWDDVSNTPEGLDDGDDDTLGGLSCRSGEVARADGSGWNCDGITHEPDWDDVQNKPSGIADGDDDTLGNLNCRSGQVPQQTGAGWQCGSSQVSVQWSDVENTPSDIADGDDDTLAELNCSTDQVARYNGSQWVCVDESDYSDGDAVSAVGQADDYVKNSEDDRMQGELDVDSVDLKGGSVKNIPTPQQDDQAASKGYVDSQATQAEQNAKQEAKQARDDRFWWGTIALDSDEFRYQDDDGSDETLPKLPSQGQVVCTSGDSACVYRDNGSYYVSILIPDSVNSNFTDFGSGSTQGSLLCWATGSGDNEPGFNPYYKTAVESFATDLNGGHDHCIKNDNTVAENAGGSQCIGIKLAGLETNSHTRISAICLDPTD